MVQQNHLGRPARTLLFGCIASALIILAMLVSPAAAWAQEAPPLPSDLALRIGEIYQKAGQTGTAAEYYLKALEADPANAEALAALQAVIAPAQPPPPNVPHLDLGRLYEDTAQPAKAAEYYLKALEEDPTSTEALAALQAILQKQQDNDPRLAIADQYLAAGQHDKAIEQYLKILADRPAQEGLQDKITAAIDDTDSMRTLLAPEGVKVGKGIALALLTFLSLLILWAVARLIRRYRKSELPNNQRRYAILAFANATGVQGLGGAQEGVRSAIADWLHTSHAAVHDSAVVEEPITLPDVGVVAKLLNWFNGQITPTLDAEYVDGTLLAARTGAAGGKEVGLTVRVRSKSGGEIGRIRTFWNPASSTDDPNAYVQLAYTAATWIFEPAKVMQCGPADLLHQANTHFVQGELQDDPARTQVEMAAAVQLATQADADEQTLATTAAASLAAGGGPIGSNVVNPSTLAAERATLYARMLTELSSP